MMDEMGVRYGTFVWTGRKNTNAPLMRYNEVEDLVFREAENGGIKFVRTPEIFRVWRKYLRLVAQMYESL